MQQPKKNISDKRIMAAKKTVNEKWLPTMTFGCTYHRAFNIINCRNDSYCMTSHYGNRSYILRTYYDTLYNWNMIKISQPKNYVDTLKPSVEKIL